MLEIGAAILALLYYDKYKDSLNTYVGPIWEITGTFSIFYIVNLEVTYPTLIPLIGELYVAPLLIGALFLIIRDTFLAFSENINIPVLERNYSKVYAIATLVTMFFFISVIGSVISGIGVNTTSLAINYLRFITSPFNILLYLSIIGIVYFAAIVFFRLEKILQAVFSLIISMVLLFLALHYYANFVLQGIINNIYLLGLPLALLIVLFVVYVFRRNLAKYFVLPFLVATIFVFQMFGYPQIFGGTLNITNYLAPSPTAGYVVIFTVAGGIFLAIALSYFVYVHHLHKKKVK
jgi:cytochrome bd ubiquinol oxidase subunit II